MKKLAVVAVICVSAVVATSAFGSSKTIVATRHTSLGTVLVDSRGHTLYLFEGDTSTHVGCTGKCLAAWPPVTGKAGASGSAKSSELGTIRRGSSRQVTYDGHPLYTFAGDDAAGQVAGQGLVLDGKKWWAVSPSGSAMTASGKGSSGSSGGGSTKTGW
jgi:predicted lipoprotein with Yx(FWY)xxD motif